MMYPAQNHFIEEYDPDDQYEIQEYFVGDKQSEQLGETDKDELASQNDKLEERSPQSSNVVN